MTTARTTSRRALIAWFTDELVRAQRERTSRQRVTDTGELEWVVYERNRLAELINAARADLGKPAVSMDAVMRVENAANGHFDYTAMLAVGAADLVLAI